MFEASVSLSQHWTKFYRNCQMKSLKGIKALSAVNEIAAARQKLDLPNENVDLFYLTSDSVP